MQLHKVENNSISCSSSVLRTEAPKNISLPNQSDVSYQQQAAIKISQHVLLSQEIDISVVLPCDKIFSLNLSDKLKHVTKGKVCGCIPALFPTYSKVKNCILELGDYRLKKNCCTKFFLELNQLTSS